MSAVLDVEILGQTLNQRRHERKLSAEDVAVELGVSPDEVRSLEAGSEPRANVALAVLVWLDAGVEDFLVDDGSPESVSDPEAQAESVAAFLRSDRDLKPESAEAIEAVLHAAYVRFSAA